MSRTDRTPLAFALLTVLAAGTGDARPPAPVEPRPRSAVRPGGPRDSPGGPPRPTAPAIAQPLVDFNHPPRAYQSRRLRGWEVLVEPPPDDEASGRAVVALARLDEDLGRIATLIPAEALRDLRRLKIFLLHGSRAAGGGRDSGLEYFRPDAPTHHAWLDPRMASSIVIFSAANYAALTGPWAVKALMHEFGHAQHLEHWPESRPDVYEAWDAAVRAGRYRDVREEDRGTHNPNYAARNHLEYFAELSATYFVGNTYFPRDRAALRAYDPAGYALVEALWGARVDAR